MKESIKRCNTLVPAIVVSEPFVNAMMIVVRLVVVLSSLAMTGLAYYATTTAGAVRQKKESPSRATVRKKAKSKIMPDGRVWTVENLNVRVPGSICFDDKEDNCRQYGRLYPWGVATKACSLLGPGWKLPSDNEWRELAKKYGGIVPDSEDTGKGAYKALINGGESGFDAVLSGGRDPDGTFARLNAHGFYWTSTVSSQTEAWMINFGKGSLLMNHHSIEKTRAVAVRCIFESK